MTKNTFVRLKVSTFCVILCLVLSVESHGKRSDEPTEKKDQVSPARSNDSPPLTPSSTKTDVNESIQPASMVPASVSNNSSSTSAQSSISNTLPKERNVTSHDINNVHSAERESEQNLPPGGVAPNPQNSKSYPPGAALRGLYVFAGLSSIVMVYIAIKLIRLRRKRTRIRKYGLLANIDEVEMRPLGAEDEDEESTLFDANQHASQQSSQQGGR